MYIYIHECIYAYIYIYITFFSETEILWSLLIYS